MSIELMAEIDTTIDELYDEDDSVDDSPDESDVTNADRNEDGKPKSKPAKKEDDDGESDDESDEDGSKEKSDEETESEEDENKKEKLSRREKRRQRHDSKVNELSQKNYALESELRELKEKASKGIDEILEPNPKDFKSQRDYDVAYGEYRANKKAASEAAERTAKENHDRDVRACDEAIGKDCVRYSDFAETVRSIKSMPLTNAVKRVITTVPNPAGVMRYLGKKPAVAAEIFKMDELSQAMFLTSISHKIREYESRKTAVVKSKAKPPAAKLPSSSSNTAKPHEMSMDDYIKWRNSKK